MKFPIPYLPLIGLLVVNSASAIIGGRPAAPGEFPEVFRLDLSSGSFDAVTVSGCSGVLVKPHLLLTSAHCLSDEFHVDHVTNTPDSSRTSSLHPKAHPQYKLDNTGNLKKRAAHDIGYILLESGFDHIPLPAIKVVETWTEAKALQSTPLIPVGYGLSSFMSSAEIQAKPDRAKLLGGKKLIGATRFDGINFVNEGVHTPFGLYMVGQAMNLGKGDSGGGVFMEENGKRFLVGLSESESYSGTSSDYTEATLLRPELLCWVQENANAEIQSHKKWREGKNAIPEVNFEGLQCPANPENFVR